MSVLDLFKLDGYCSIVTGGSIGLGKAMATALAEAGSDIVLAATNLERTEKTAVELRKLGRKVIAVACDVSKEADCDRLVAIAMAEFGKIDVLVNNAGISIHAPAEDMTYDQWMQVINVNLTGVFLMARNVGREMIKRQKGSIINISSISGIIANTPQGQSAYNASKGGVILLTKSLASEWVGHNIRVNTIAPAYMNTEMITELVKHGDQSMVSKWIEMTPMKRFGEPSELGGIAVYLASEASSLATGGVFVIDGGYTSW
jgi:NAD(P)-dependent dehydrogenase (short-subunit alcohol dehydrogenase family)